MGLSNLSSAFINKVTNFVGEVVNLKKILLQSEKALPLCTRGQPSNPVLKRVSVQINTISLTLLELSLEDNFMKT